MGKLIAIEGLDGSGKGTQTALLLQRFEQEDLPARKISFPNYEAESAALVKLYLQGAFGSDPGDVNAYAASSFYAVDRYASFRTDWGQDYQNGCWMLADRYTTANMIYQLTKLPPSQWDNYLAWLADFEYKKLGLPVPDLVIYLEVPVAHSQQMLLQRYGGDEGKKDIHERDIAFLQACAACATYTAKALNWTVVHGVDAGTLRTRDAIHQEIWQHICAQFDLKGA